MIFEDVVAKLVRAEIEHVIHEHEPTLTMNAVEQSGKFNMDFSLKTLVFRAPDRIVAGVLIGRHRVDYGALAKACNVSRKSLRTMEPSQVIELLGDTPGGVGPIQKPDVAVFVDLPIAEMGVVSCGAGRPDRTVELAAADLIDITNAAVAAISHPSAVSESLIDHRVTLV